MSFSAPVVARTLAVPDAPALVAGFGRATLLTTDGEMLDLAGAEVGAALAETGPPLLVHAPATWRRLGLPRLPCLDLLELFAFVAPAHNAVPTPRGLALALDMDFAPSGAGWNRETAASAIPSLAQALLARLSAGRDLSANRDAARLAARMGQAGWAWTPFVLAALGQEAAQPALDALRAWTRLPEWEDTGPRPPPSAHPVTPAEVRARLARILGPGAEQRPGQADFAAAASAAFRPREQAGDPHVVLAEAGTGTGKTLGYVAPASLWAERNGGVVWISTFTRHLQRQVEAELARLFPDPVERRRRVVVRKGRENYLCLLRFEEAAGRTAMNRSACVQLGLVARWIAATGDGDMEGGDMPGWFAELFGPMSGLRIRRGECLHGGCPHYRKCFVEHTIRRARTADLVVANHALTIAQAGLGGPEDAHAPTHYVFDEGHHIFDAADNAFAVKLSGLEASELRLWLLGPEEGRPGSRGLRRRLDGLVEGDAAREAALEAALSATRALPAPGWGARIAEEDGPLDAAAAGNPTETFLRLVRRQLLARTRARGPDAEWFGVECDLHPVGPELPPAAAALAERLLHLQTALAALVAGLAARVDDEAEDLDTGTRVRIETVCRSIASRGVDLVRAWRAMLAAVGAPAPEIGASPQFVMLMRSERRFGARGPEMDFGLHRHWLDPTMPFIETLAKPAQGLLVTSATLRDAGEATAERAWATAEGRVGGPHLAAPPHRVAVTSPFDYAAQTRALVVSDVNVNEVASLAAAFRTLFVASRGGGLGLFTAISRLRAVHGLIAAPLEAAGIPLLAQHVDDMGNATLVDVFRTEEASCLLGTDAMRDGIDVPGRALRLVVFERVPWNRNDILHRERRTHLSGNAPYEFDDRAVRMRLRQAFGRLIRSATDRGVFVLLGSQTPSRLMSAFPQGVEVRTTGLADAAREVAAFVGQR